MASLRLSLDQQAAITAMRRVLMHNMGVLLRRRQELVSLLTVRSRPACCVQHSLQRICFANPASV